MGKYIAFAIVFTFIYCLEMAMKRFIGFEDTVLLALAVCWASISLDRSKDNK